MGTRGQKEGVACREGGGAIECGGKEGSREGGLGGGGEKGGRAKGEGGCTGHDTIYYSISRCNHTFDHYLKVPPWLQVKPSR
jgi:hypothetical protein